MTDPHADERDDLLEALAKHRALFWGTVEGLSDEQAAATPTASELCLGGLVKHVAAVERQWCSFIRSGPDDGPGIDWSDIDWSAPPPEVLAYRDQFRLVEGETLASVLEDARSAAAETEGLVRTADLGHRWPLPSAPWFPPGATWSVRRVVVHLVAEISQHAGHADILRESIDGRKSMG